MQNNKTSIFASFKEKPNNSKKEQKIPKFKTSIGIALNNQELINKETIGSSSEEEEDYYYCNKKIKYEYEVDIEKELNLDKKKKQTKEENNKSYYLDVTKNKQNLVTQKMNYSEIMNYRIDTIFVIGLEKNEILTSTKPSFLGKNMDKTVKTNDIKWRYYETEKKDIKTRIIKKENDNKEEKEMIKINKEEIKQIEIENKKETIQEIKKRNILKLVNSKDSNMFNECIFGFSMDERRFYYEMFLSNLSVDETHDYKKTIVKYFVEIVQNMEGDAKEVINKYQKYIEYLADNLKKNQKLTAIIVSLIKKLFLFLKSCLIQVFSVEALIDNDLLGFFIKLQINNSQIEDAILAEIVEVFYCLGYNEKCFGIVQMLSKLKKNVIEETNNAEDYFAKNVFGPTRKICNSSWVSKKDDFVENELMFDLCSVLPRNNSCIGSVEEDVYETVLYEDIDKYLALLSSHSTYEISNSASMSKLCNLPRLNNNSIKLKIYNIINLDYFQLIHPNNLSIDSGNTYMIYPMFANQTCEQPNGSALQLLSQTNINTSPLLQPSNKRLVHLLYDHYLLNTSNSKETLFEYINHIIGLSENNKESELKIKQVLQKDSNNYYVWAYYLSFLLHSLNDKQKAPAIIQKIIKNTPQNKNEHAKGYYYMLKSSMLGLILTSNDPHQMQLNNNIIYHTNAQLINDDQCFASDLTTLRINNYYTSKIEYILSHYETAFNDQDSIFNLIDIFMCHILFVYSSNHNPISSLINMSTQYYHKLKTLPFNDNVLQSPLIVFHSHILIILYHLSTLHKVFDYRTITNKISEINQLKSGNKLALNVCLLISHRLGFNINKQIRPTHLINSYKACLIDLLYNIITHCNQKEYYIDYLFKKILNWHSNNKNIVLIHTLYLKYNKNKPTITLKNIFNNTISKNYTMKIYYLYYLQLITAQDQSEYSQSIKDHVIQLMLEKEIRIHYNQLLAN